MTAIRRKKYAVNLTKNAVYFFLSLVLIITALSFWAGYRTGMKKNVTAEAVEMKTDDIVSRLQADAEIEKKEIKDTDEINRIIRKLKTEEEKPKAAAPAKTPRVTEPAPKIKAPLPPSATARPGEKKWVIQALATKNLTQAEGARDRLIKRGVTAFISETATKMYRVRIGYFASHDEAAGYKKELEDKGIIAKDGWITNN